LLLLRGGELGLGILLACDGKLSGACGGGGSGDFGCGCCGCLLGLRCRGAPLVTKACEEACRAG
jgi:hypothetical protein